MFNILSRYENYKVIFEKFRQSKDFQKGLFECFAKYPSYSLGTNDTQKATNEMYLYFENWLFNLDDSISDLEYTAFLDAFSNNLHTMIREYFVNLDQMQSNSATKQSIEHVSI